MFQMQSGKWFAMVKGQQNISFFVKLCVTHGLYYFIRLVTFSPIQNTLPHSILLYGNKIKKIIKKCLTRFTELIITKNFTSRLQQRVVKSL